MGVRPPVDRWRGDPDPQTVFPGFREGIPAGARLQFEIQQQIAAIPSIPAGQQASQQASQPASQPARQLTNQPASHFNFFDKDTKL
jgi:hypothetical protein